jgi:hypothetical protein
MPPRAGSDPRALYQCFVFVLQKFGETKKIGYTK